MAKRKMKEPKAPTEMAFLSVLSTPWTFLQPTDDLQTLVATSTKQILDPLAASVVEEQSTRRQSNKKRKRIEDASDVAHPPLQLKNLYVDGFTSNQIWEQATRILEAAGNEVERDLTLLVQQNDHTISDSEEQSDHIRFSDSEEIEPESGDDDDDDDEDDGSSMSNDTPADAAVDELAESNSELNYSDEDEVEGIESLNGDLTTVDERSTSSDENAGVYVEDKFGLNDGFFSIDDFNKQTEMWERKDANGEPLDADDSDEDFDWDSNPLANGSKNSLPNKTEEVDDMDVDESEDDGPTFGNADLSRDSDSDEDVPSAVDADMPALMDTSEIKYADFFAPPPRKASSKKARALPKTQLTEPVLDDDVDRAIADVRRDLFDDESEVDDDGAMPDDAGDQHTHQSSHEKQKARIADEIRRLEAANVAKKEWMVAGEARAVERPVNSLIEEDLDFERVGKPVPVVTNETTEDIEELVKRRILAKEFDEVIRRRPGSTDPKASRSSRFELEDTKPQQSLAELYETDHLRATDPNYVDSKDRKLMREHAEVTNIWKEISSQLDTLSNWHYKPQAPQANINVVTDTPTILMEEARPTAGSAAGGPSALAPQEIYAPGDDGRVAGELVLKNGATISKEEMTREEKARARRQKKTQMAHTEPTPQKGKSAEKQQLVSDLRKGGVKVVNKEGKVTDLQGARVEADGKRSADVLKL